MGLTDKHQPELAMETSYKTEEVGGNGFLALAERQKRGEIRMLLVTARGLKDAWTWRVTYRIEKGSS
jgi:hypothetical protein